MNSLATRTVHPPLHVQIRVVPPLQPFTWLRRGMRDLEWCSRADLGHAGLMVVLGWILLFMLGVHPYLLAAALSGFLLGAPAMTMGIVELSRRLEARATINFNDSLTPLERDGPALVQFVVFLAAVAATWFIVSGALLKAVLHVSPPDFVNTFYRGFLDTLTKAQLVSYLLTGGVLALLVFVLSVVTVPLIIDQHASASQAMRVSLATVRANLPAMVVWSGLLVIGTVFGFLTFLIGMLIVIPLLGHATWHAYRDLIRV